MRILNEIAYQLMVPTGWTRAASWLNREKTMVLAFHDVYAGAHDPLRNFDGMHVRVEHFERQMRYLAAHYEIVTLDQLLEPRAGRGGKPLAAITIDDGYRNTFLYAFPVLRRLGLPATVFIVTDFLLRGRVPWWDRLRAMVAATTRPAVRVLLHGSERWVSLETVEDRKAGLREVARELQGLPPERREAMLRNLAADLSVDERGIKTYEALSVDDLREMVDGGISVGSHGCSHDSFLHLTREQVREQLFESRRVLESVTGCAITWLAYPYGDFSRVVVEAAIEAGYRGAVTTVEGLNHGTPDPYAIRRIGVDDHLSFAHFVVMVSGLRDFLKAPRGEGRARTASAVRLA